MECLLSWIEKHQGLAAWVQAVFSILAIFAAIGISYSQTIIAKRQSRADRDERYKKSLINLYGVMDSFYTTIKEISTCKNNPETVEIKSDRQQYRTIIDNNIVRFNLIDTRDFPTSGTFKHANKFVNCLQLASIEANKYKNSDVDEVPLRIADLYGEYWSDTTDRVKVCRDEIKKELDSY